MKIYSIVSLYFFPNCVIKILLKRVKTRASSTCVSLQHHLCLFKHLKSEEKHISKEAAIAAVVKISEKMFEQRCQKAN